MKTKDIFMYALGALMVVGFFSVLGLLIFQPIPEQNSDVLYLVIGSLLAGFATVYNYFYGSSKGSSEKNEMLKK